MRTIIELNKREILDCAYKSHESNFVNALEKICGYIETKMHSLDIDIKNLDQFNDAIEHPYIKTFGYVIQGLMDEKINIIENFTTKEVIIKFNWTRDGLVFIFSINHGYCTNVFFFDVFKIGLTKLIVLYWEKVKELINMELTKLSSLKYDLIDGYFKQNNSTQKLFKEQIETIVNLNFV